MKASRSPPPQVAATLTVFDPGAAVGAGLVGAGVAVTTCGTTTVCCATTVCGTTTVWTTGGGADGAAHPTAIEPNMITEASNDKYLWPNMFPSYGYERDS